MVKQLTKSARDSRAKTKEPEQVEAVRAERGEVDRFLDQAKKSKGATGGFVSLRKNRDRGNLSSNEEKEIESNIISSLNKIEDDDTRLRLFNGVASALGYTTVLASKSEPDAEPSSAHDLHTLPEVAPQFYRERPDAKETAELFLRRVYEPWLATNSLFQFHIGKLDPPLLQGLKNQFKGRAEELRAILPTKTDAVSQRLAALVGKEIDDPAQRRLLAQAERSLNYAMAKLKR